MYPSSDSWDIAVRTVAGLTLAVERRAMSSEATGLAVVTYWSTSMFKTELARCDSIFAPCSRSYPAYRRASVRAGLESNKTKLTVSCVDPMFMLLLYYYTHQTSGPLVKTSEFCFPLCGTKGPFWISLAGDGRQTSAGISGDSPLLGSDEGWWVEDTIQGCRNGLFGDAPCRRIGVSISGSAGNHTVASYSRAYPLAVVSARCRFSRSGTASNFDIWRVQWT